MLRIIFISINLPKTDGSRNQTELRFYLILRIINKVINFPKACGPRSQAWPMFSLILRYMPRRIFPKQMIQGTRHS